MNTPVSFEIAKLLKDKGFNEKSFGKYYTLNGKDWNFAEINDYFRLDDEISIGGKFSLLAPTISEVVMWIFEKHGIWISIDRYIDPEQSPDYRYGSCIYYIDHYYGSNNENPTDAYLSAIEYTLKNLI